MRNLEERQRVQFLRLLPFLWFAPSQTVKEAESRAQPLTAVRALGHLDGHQPHLVTA